MTDDPRDVSAPVGVRDTPADVLSGKGRSRMAVAGIFLIVAGLGAVAEALVVLMPNPFETISSSLVPAMMSSLVTIIGALGVVVGTMGAYIAFFRAGFPSRSALVRVATIGIVVIYAIVPLAGGLLVPRGGAWGLTTSIVTAVGGALLVVLAISAARNRSLPRGLRILPGVQVVLLAAGYIAGSFTAFPVTGLALLAVGTAYLVLSASPTSADDVAASASPQAGPARSGA